jgi:hypothetical protein
MWGVVALLVLGALIAGLLIGRRRRPAGSADRSAASSGTGHRSGDADHHVVGMAGPTDGAAPTAGNASAGQRDADR